MTSLLTYTQELLLEEEKLPRRPSPATPERRSASAAHARCGAASGRVSASLPHCPARLAAESCFHLLLSVASFRCPARLAAVSGRAPSVGLVRIPCAWRDRRRRAAGVNKSQGALRLLDAGRGAFSCETAKRGSGAPLSRCGSRQRCEGPSRFRVFPWSQRAGCPVWAG